jgi:hypothetical protein
MQSKDFHATRMRYRCLGTQHKHSIQRRTPEKCNQKNFGGTPREKEEEEQPI